jgi:predicted RNase H-like HicB family nuclease
MKSYTVLYEEGPTSWGASVPDLPGCFAVGDTREEAETLIREAIEMYIAALKEDGQPVPEPATTVGLISVAA